MNKQLVSVLEAVRNGYATSSEVASATGLPQTTCSAMLSVLTECGSVVVTGSLHNRMTGRPQKVHIATS